MYPTRSSNGYGNYGGGSPDSPFWRSLMMLANVVAAYCSFIFGQMLYIKTEAAMSNILIATYGDDNFGLYVYWIACFCGTFTVARMSVIALISLVTMASIRLAFRFGAFAF